MTAKQKKLFLLTSVMSVFVMAVAVLFTGGKLSLQPISVKGSGTEINNSITFNGFSNVSGHGESTKSLKNGGTIKAYSTTTLSNGDVVVSSTNFLLFAYVDNGVENTNLTIGASSRACAPFENLTSIKVSYNGTGGMTLNYSTNGTSWSSTTTGSNVTNTSIAGAKYIYLSTASGTSYVSQIILSYSCTGDGGGSDPEPQGGLSGKYDFVSDFYGYISSLTFTSSTQGNYTYSGETLYFTYSISDTTITFTYVSGDNTGFGTYRLFAGGTSPTPNATGKVVSDTQITVKTYNTFGTATTRTFNK